jgi:hypothetical protein
VIGSVVNHEDSILSPVGIGFIQVIAELNQEQHEGVAIVLSTVDSVHEPAITTYRCYHTQRSESLHCGHHIPLACKAPTMLSLIRLVKNTFINVDDDFALSHVLDIVSCSKLPLELSLLLIVSIINWLHFLVGETQLKLEIAIDHRLAHVKLNFFFDGVS